MHKAKSSALALLEFGSVAVGVLAVDRMLKRSPVGVLRCGTVHPGLYLALVGGSVASTQEAHAEGVGVGEDAGVLLDDICLPDPHAALVEALDGGRRAPRGEAVGVIEVSTSPALLAVLDAVLKAVPVDLVEGRLADDLGGRAVAIIDGTLSDVREALELAGDSLSRNGGLLGTALLPRVDETLRHVLGEGTHFAGCRRWEPAGAEVVEEETCSWER